MKLHIFATFFVLLGYLVLGSFTYGQPAVPISTQATVVRAYPNDISSPEKGGDYTVELGEEINLDVRGLGVWFINLHKRGVDLEVVKTFIAPALDRNGNVQVNTEDWISNVVAASKSLCLYIDGRPFNNVLPIRVDPRYSNAEKHRDLSGCPLFTLKYSLKRDTQGGGVPDAVSPTYKQWDDLITTIYGRMKFFKPQPTDITVGMPGRDGIGVYYLSSSLNPRPEDKDPKDTTIRIRPFSSFLMRLSLLFLFFVLLIGGILAKYSNLIRDTTAIPNPGGECPFSLGKCQLAVWTIVILGSYLFIWLSTQDYNRFSMQAVGLLGISVTTGLGAFAVNRMSPTGIAASSLSPDELNVSIPVKLKTLMDAETVVLQSLPIGDAKISVHEKRRQELQQRYDYVRRPIIQFLSDIFTEENSVSLHRFQLIVWTVVLACVFVMSVISTLQMPVFDSTILVLMGISGGTYVGFKWPSTTKE